jgi:uncharacterized protein
MDSTVTAFLEGAVIARGDRGEVRRLLAERTASSDHHRIRVFDDASGRVTDLEHWDAAKAAPRPPRGRGRPRLGVKAREVTLLPRQWEWLAAQPGGTSAAIRRLVDQARRSEPDSATAGDAVYCFITEIGGDRPNYEEALRALYRGDLGRFRELIADWPADVRDYAGRLLSGAGG